MTNQELFDALQSSKTITWEGSRVIVIGVKPESGAQNGLVSQWIVTMAYLNGVTKDNYVKTSLGNTLFTVLRTAHGRNWETTSVYVPNYVSRSTHNLLHTIVSRSHTTNPFDSVSPGDVILIDGHRWLVCNQGFRQLTQGEYEQYCMTATTSRAFSPLLDKPTLGHLDETISATEDIELCSTAR